MTIEVSVVTTLFNYKQYISDSIKSFIDQDFLASEMVIVDDASIDNPIEVIQPWLDQYPTRLKYIRLDVNSGYSHAKNIGIKACSGEILVMLDADDMLTPYGISIRYAELKKGYDFVHGPVLDKCGKSIEVSSLWNKWIKSSKDKNCWMHVHAQGVMLRKDVHRNIGLYDETMWCKSDREMWARIFLHDKKIGWVRGKKDYVSIYRLHDEQMHRSNQKKKQNNSLKKEMFHKIAKRITDLSDVEMLS